MSQADQLTAPTVTVQLEINGKIHSLDIPTQASLLDVLRERLHLTGTKKGCDHGQCGACTVHLGGEANLSCLTLAVMAQGQPITTIEGLSGKELHPIQQAFLDQDAYQCGYCTPGQIMSAAACVSTEHASSEAEIREFMSGNICRCGAYSNIVRAVQQVAGTLPDYPDDPKSGFDQSPEQQGTQQGTQGSKHATI